MIRRYVATLAIAVFLVTLAVSTMPFVVRSCVLSGQSVDENLSIEFTFDADSNHTYEITPEGAQSLENDIRFYGEGSARVLSTHVGVTPKSISWKDGNVTRTAPGGVMTAQLRWDTPPDSPNGATGTIFMDFPNLFAGSGPTFHSGQYERNGNKFVIRELTIYQSPFQLYFVRFNFALVAGLPFGILLHTIYWAFVLKREKRVRIENLPKQGYGLPQTFHANPIAEWTTGLIVLGIGAGMSSMFAGISVADNFIGSTMVPVIYCILAAAIIIAMIVAFSTRRSVLSVHVDSNGLSYMRGRKEPRWIINTWNEILTIVEKSRKYRGTTYYWIEIEFQDKRKKLKIPTSIVGYPALRALLFDNPKS